MARFKIKKNVAIKKWRSRARLIDIRKTKITFIKLGETDTDNFGENEEGNEEIMATPVTIIGGNGDQRELWTQASTAFQDTKDKIEGTPVEISPI